MIYFFNTWTVHLKDSFNIFWQFNKLAVFLLSAPDSWDRLLQPPCSRPDCREEGTVSLNLCCKKHNYNICERAVKIWFCCMKQITCTITRLPPLNVITPVYLSFITILMSGEKICYPWNKVHLGIYHKLDFDVLEDLLIESLMKSYPFVRRTFLDFTAGFSASLIFPICCSWTCIEDSVSAFSGSHPSPLHILLFSAARNCI